MFINMTKPSPVMAALAEMQGKSFVLSSNQLENVVYQKKKFRWLKWCNKERCLVPINVVECHWKFNSTRISTPYTVKRHEKMCGVNKSSQSTWQCLTFMMILMLRTTIVILVISSVHYFEKIWILVNFIWEDDFGHFYWSYFQQTILNIRSGKLSDLCSFETADQVPASLVAEVWWKELF